jgi:hypothetical protein
MAKKEGKKGKSLPVRAPEWEPILNLAPDHIDDFMWMYAVQLSDGTRLQVYKHYWTRNSLHLDNEGRAFIFTVEERYREIEPGWLLARVLREDYFSKESDSFVGHNYGSDEGQLRWTRAATRHRISRERSRYVIEHCGLWFWRRGPRPRYSSGKSDRVLFFGDDIEGVPLEVFAIEGTEGALTVIHAMNLRDRYRGLHEEARQWQT